MLTYSDEAKFLSLLSDSTEIPNPVSFSDAKKHLDESIAINKGYHSQAVQDIVNDLRETIQPDIIETVNLESKLAEYHQWLDAGDDSNGSDIE